MSFDEKKLRKTFKDYSTNNEPKPNYIKRFAMAFIVGGFICTLGQGIGDVIKHYGVEEKAADSMTLLILIALSALLTGLNIYPKIGNFAGAGALVPITGFANSVAASAIEFKAEGFVMGLGCKIFTIAGPVILYGIFSSWILGVIYWAGQMFSWW